MYIIYMGYSVIGIEGIVVTDQDLHIVWSWPSNMNDDIIHHCRLKWPVSYMCYYTMVYCFAWNCKMMTWLIVEVLDSAFWLCIILKVDTTSSVWNLLAWSIYFGFDPESSTTLMQSLALGLTQCSILLTFVKRMKTFWITRTYRLTRPTQYNDLLRPVAML